MAANRFNDVERKLDALIGGQDELQRGHNELWQGVNELRRGLNETESRLQIRMGVLHEEVISRIAALAPDFSPIRREFQRRDDELREEFDRRLVPLEAFVRTQRKPKP